MICFWSCENESRLDHQVSKFQDGAGMVGAGKAGKQLHWEVNGTNARERNIYLALRSTDTV
jgi:hypothetical protein